MQMKLLKSKEDFLCISQTYIMRLISLRRVRGRHVLQEYHHHTLSVILLQPVYLEQQRSNTSIISKVASSWSDAGRRKRRSGQEWKPDCSLKNTRASWLGRSRLLPLRCAAPERQLTCGRGEGLHPVDWIRRACSGMNLKYPNAL